MELSAMRPFLTHTVVHPMLPEWMLALADGCFDLRYIVFSFL